MPFNNADKAFLAHDTLEASRAARATQPRVAGVVVTRGNTGQSGWTATRPSGTVGWTGRPRIWAVTPRTHAGAR